VNVTIDGATAATAESIRVNLDFHRIEANIERLIAIRDAAHSKQPKVRVSMVAMPQTIPEWEPFHARWSGVADYVGMGGFSSRLTSVAEVLKRPGLPLIPPEPSTQREASACKLPFSELNIWADGKAVLCCQDWNEEHVVGDLATQTIDEIWHGERMTEARRKHIARIGHEISICAKCDRWERPSAGARLWS
jgi:hypothetical protein